MFDNHSPTTFSAAFACMWSAIQKRAPSVINYIAVSALIDGLKRLRYALGAGIDMSPSGCIPHGCLRVAGSGRTSFWTMPSVPLLSVPRIKTKTPLQKKGLQSGHVQIVLHYL